MDKTLICTVGTSFFNSNLEKIMDQFDPLYVAYSKKYWKGLAQRMLQIEPHERMLGSEINTIELILESMEKKGDRLERIIFLVSDTEDGRNTGLVLKEYFEQRAKRDRRLAILSVQHWTVDDLQPQEPERFKKSGLLNLVRCIAKGIKEAGGASKVFIDATGGYKAQIAIAVMFGQALGVDVIYKHESFGNIIDFPPMPVSLDFHYFELYNDLFNQCYLSAFEPIPFEDLAQYFSDNIPDYDDLQKNADFSNIKLFFEAEQINGKYFFSINHAGLIYIEAAQQRGMQFVATFIPPEPSPKRTPPKFTDDHFPKGFKEYSDKIWSSEPWIDSIRSLPYDKQRGIAERGFYVERRDGIPMIVGTYRDSQHFGTRFNIQCDRLDNIAKIYAATKYLNSKKDEY